MQVIYRPCLALGKADYLLSEYRSGCFTLHHVELYRLSSGLFAVKITFLPRSFLLLLSELDFERPNSEKLLPVDLPTIYDWDVEKLIQSTQ